MARTREYIKGGTVTYKSVIYKHGKTAPFLTCKDVCDYLRIDRDVAPLFAFICGNDFSTRGSGVENAISSVRGFRNSNASGPMKFAKNTLLLNSEELSSKNLCVHPQQTVCAYHASTHYVCMHTMSVFDLLQSWITVIDSIATRPVMTWSKKIS